jgi:hypothetical protein
MGVRTADPNGAKLRGDWDASCHEVATGLSPEFQPGFNPGKIMV